jgi:hypothetical protein
MIVDISIVEVEDQTPAPDFKGKDPAAISLGKRGGLKGYSSAIDCSPRRPSRTMRIFSSAE